jgi:ABC-2 type transport system permease protein
MPDAMIPFTAILKNELVKISRRPRSYIGFAVITFICIMLQFAFYQDGKAIMSFVTQQLENAFNIQGKILNGNLVCFILLQTLIVQLPLLVALVTGDIMSGETASGTIRFLLTRPASRTKIVLAKWVASLIYTLLLLAWLGVLALFLSRAVFGVSDMIAMGSDSITIIKADDINWRYAYAFLIAFLSLSLIASLANMLSVIMDNSITPIVTVMAIIIVFTIMGTFEAPIFDLIRPYLFTTHMISWRSMFEDPLPKSDILKSCLILIGHIAVFLGVSIVYFKRKDVIN